MKLNIELCSKCKNLKVLNDICITCRKEHIIFSKKECDDYEEIKEEDDEQ